MDFSRINTLQMDSNAQIISLLSKNSEITNKISGLRNALQQLSSNQKKMADLFLVFGKEKKSINKAKNDFKNELVERIMTVVTIMHIFAYDKKKRNLKKQLLMLTPEYLKNCSDDKLTKISKKIWMIANKFGGNSLAFIKKNKSSLNAFRSRATLLKNEYGLMPEMIKNIEEAYIKFLETLLLYEDEMKEKKKVARKINKLGKQTEKLLANKIDRYVQLFKIENPLFYKDYYMARENKLQNNLLVSENVEPKVESEENTAKTESFKKTESEIKSKTPQGKPPVKK